MERHQEIYMRGICHNANLYTINIKLHVRSLFKLTIHQKNLRDQSRHIEIMHVLGMVVCYHSPKRPARGSLATIIPPHNLRHDSNVQHHLANGLPNRKRHSLLPLKTKTSLTSNKWLFLPPKTVECRVGSKRI